MNVKTLLTAVAALAISQGAWAVANSYRSDVNSTGNWSNRASWDVWNGSAWVDAGDVPGSDDDVLIRAGDTITVNLAFSATDVIVDGTLTVNANLTLSDTLVPSLDINSGGSVSVAASVTLTAERVNIDSGGTMTVTGTANLDNFVVAGNLNIAAGGLVALDGSADATHEVSGNIYLQGSASILRFNDRPHTLAPSGGAITGQNAAALIEIEDSFQLTSRMLIQGMLEMQPTGAGTATFDNARLDADASPEGQVIANAAGVFAFDANLILDDTLYSVGGTFRPLYQASGNSSAVLQFNRESLSLVGDFVVDDCAEFEFNADVVTTGSFTDNGGEVDVNNDSCFDAGNISPICSDDTSC